MKEKLRTVALAVALIVSALPSVAAESKDPVVAKVNGQEIHQSDIMRVAVQLGPQAQQMPPQVLLPQLVQRLIVTKLVAEKGYADKLQNSKAVKDRVKEAEEQIVADEYVRKAVEPMITDAKVQAKYDELSAKFKPVDEIRASHILVATEAEANDILKQLKDGADFAKLATEKSKDSGSAKQGGDLGYFTKEAMVKPFSEAAFSMKVGDLSDKPVKTDFGYHIIKLVDKRKSSPPPLSDVKGQITQQLAQEMAQQIVKQLEAKAKIEKFNWDGTPLKAAEKPADKAKDKAPEKK